MNENKEHLWQAYLDSELSVIEAADFEASLTDTEQVRLMADMRFERALAERLSEGAECPKEVWARTRELISRQKVEGAPRVARRKRWYWGASTLVAAAGLALVISIFAAPGGSREASAVIMSAKNVDELALTSEVQPGPDFAEQFIQEKGVDLQILDDSELIASKGPHSHLNHHWFIHIVGAREEAFEGGTVTEVLINCCQFPMKILFANVDSGAARRIGIAAAKDGHVQATRVIGDYVVAVVGRHRSYQLLDLFSE